jgi:hypothetical protein
MFECVKCEYITTSKSNYTKHLKTQKHTKTEESFLCTTCNKSYKCRQSLWRHQKTHNETLLIKLFYKLIQDKLTYSQLKKEIQFTVPMDTSHNHKFANKCLDTLYSLVNSYLMLNLQI